MQQRYGLLERFGHPVTKTDIQQAVIRFGEKPHHKGIDIQFVMVSLQQAELLPKKIEVKDGNAKDLILPVIGDKSIRYQQYCYVGYYKDD